MTTHKSKHKFEIFLLTLNPADLPEARHLSIDFVRMYAKRISQHFTESPPKPIKNKNHFEYKSEIYEVKITSKIHEGVINRAQCMKFWTKAIEKKTNEDRLLNEAKYQIVGEQKNKKINSPNKPQLYCSDKTLKRAKEKLERNQKSLAKLMITNTITGETKNLLEIATENEENRASEIYHIIKNLEHLADEKCFIWLFITLTAPAEYHPNPTKGRRRYDCNLGIRASHEYINTKWGQIQSVLSTRDIPASPETYFGIRTLEPHKDGSMHWHLLLFAKGTLIEGVTRAIREKFKTEAAAKIVTGRNRKEKESAKAASYIYKYISKSLSKKKKAQSTQDDIEDDAREDKDLASIRNKDRVQAAIKAIGARQYQSIGVNRLTTTYRKINKLKMDELDIPSGSLAAFIREKIWRNKLGYYQMLKNIEPFKKGGDISLITEPSKNSYGEPTKRVKAIKIGDIVISTESEYKIERICHMEY